MAFESFIGWRYLYRRGGGRASAGALIVFLAATAAGLAVFLHATASGPATEGARFHEAVFGVALLLGGLFLALVAALLRRFSVFTTVAITGVMLGVAALAVVLGVTSGFQREFQDKVLGVNAHVIVMKSGVEYPEYREVIKRLSGMPGVQGASPFIFTEMQAARGTVQSGGLLVKGIEPASSSKVLDLPRHLQPGSARALEELEARGAGEEPGLIVGHVLARKLKVKVGDQVRLVSPMRGLPGAQPRSARDYRIVGVFAAGFEDYDKRLVYVHLKEAQRLKDMGDHVSGVEARLDDPDRAMKMARGLEKTLGPTYRIIDWQELNHNLFKAIANQKLIISLFLTLIMAVGCFNVVASLSLIVLSKRREISMLKAMGAGATRTAAVFLVAGMTIGAIGVAAGMTFGLVICAAAGRFGYPLDPKIYLISQLPVRIDAIELGLTAVATLVICCLASIYPAVRAARLTPVEGLRQE